MFVSIVLPDKLPGQNGCDKEDEQEDHQFLGIFDIFLK